jgi:hypothetical protein
VEIALFFVEALARLAVDGLETIAAVVQDLLDLVALGRVEIELRSEPIDNLRGKRRRTAGAATKQGRTT